MADKNFKITLDLDQSSSIPSKGLHVALTKDAEVKDNKAGDGQNLVITYEIQTKGEKGRRVTMSQSLKSTVAWRYSQVLAAYGFTGSAATVSRKDLVGKLVKVQISHEDWQGEDRARVDRVLPHVTGKPGKPVEPDEPEDDEDEEEDEEQAPAPKAKKGKRKKKPEPEPEPEDDDEDEDDDDEDEDDDPENDVPF